MPQQLITQSAKATADALTSALTSRSALIALPMYDWESKDAYQTFTLFRQTLDNWLFLNWVKTDSEDHLHYIFAALGTKALELHTQWMPPGTVEVCKATKAKASAFLQKIQDGMTHEVNTHVWLAELEDITAKPNEDPQELVACIKTIMDRCEMLNDAHWEHELCCRIIHAYQNDVWLLDKLMAKSFKTPLSELINITVNHFAIQWAWEQVSSSMKPINAIRQEKQWSGRGHSGHGHTQPSYPECGNCTRCHQPGRSHCPARDSKCMKCHKIGHWQPKCQGGRPPPKTDDSQRGQCGTWHGTFPPRGQSGHNKRADVVDVGTDDIAQDEITMYWIQIDEVPEEIIIGDITTGHSEAFTNVTLPASAGDKAHTASTRVKVDTGVGGNILPLQLFRQMYPDQVGPDGLPKGLTSTQTWLTAYNGTQIPQHRALDTWTRWKPHNEKPQHLHTRWYVANTQGPAILALPSSQRLGVVTMNCTVHLKTSPSQWQQANNGPTSSQQKLPLFQNPAVLLWEFPDHFKGIGHFTGKYHITLKPDVRPIIHPPWKCPIAMRPHVWAKLEHLEHLEIIRKVDEPIDWVSSLTYAWKPNGRVQACLDAKELNNCIKRDHHRTPTVEEITHNFAGSTVFSKVDGTASYYCIELDDASQLLTTFNTIWPILLSSPAPRTLLQPRHLPEEDWPDPGTVHRCHWNCRWLLYPWKGSPRAQCQTAPLHASCLRTWTRPQHRQMQCCTMTDSFLWTCLQCTWMPSRSCKGWSCSCYATTNL